MWRVVFNELNTWKHKSVYIAVIIWFALWYSVKDVLWFLIFPPLYFLWEAVPYLILLFPVMFLFIKGNRNLKLITSLVSLTPLLSVTLIPFVVQENKLRNTIPSYQAFIDYVGESSFRSSEKLMIDESMIRYDKISETLYVKLMIDSDKITDDMNHYFKDRDRVTIPNYVMGQVLYYFVQVPEGMSRLTVKPSKLIFEAYWDQLYLGSFNYKKEKRSYVPEGALPKLSFEGVVKEEKWILEAEDRGISIVVPLEINPLTNQKVTLESYLQKRLSSYSKH